MTFPSGEFCELYSQIVTHLMILNQQLISKIIKLDDINLSINDIKNNNVFGRHIINFK